MACHGHRSLGLLGESRCFFWPRFWFCFAPVPSKPLSSNANIDSLMHNLKHLAPASPLSWVLFQTCALRFFALFWPLEICAISRPHSMASAEYHGQRLMATRETHHRELLVLLCCRKMRWLFRLVWLLAFVGRLIIQVLNSLCEEASSVVHSHRSCLLYRMPQVSS